MKILVLNAGSSTHKLSLYDIEDFHPKEPVWKATIDWGRGEGASSWAATTSQGAKLSEPLEKISIQQGIEKVLKSLWQGPTKVIEDLSNIECIGHRVVHGGSTFQEPTLINQAVKEQIRALIPLAPLHNPANLEGIEIMERCFPKVPQVAVFDTAFHAQMPEEVKTYPLPYAWKKEGIERYGFHGISHHYCAERAADLLQKRLEDLKIISCHLGNGASLCAVKGGKSVNNTMGLTPLEGLMMGTRCGSVDPGILLYVLREKRLSVEELDQILNFESGLKGIAGSLDMRDILASEEPSAKLAFAMYVYRLKFYIGALSAHLEGVDVLIFTGGIGENAAPVRQAACQGLGYMGIEINERKNEQCQPDQEITSVRSKVCILVVHTREEWMIAKSCMNLCERRKRQ